MAKKKTPTPRSAARKKTAPKPRSQTQKQDMTSAEEELQLAREQLRQAEEYYDEVRVKAAEEAEDSHETTLGDVVDRVLEFVKKHPDAGIIGAATIGFLLGRITRR